MPGRGQCSGGKMQQGKSERQGLRRTKSPRKRSYRVRRAIALARHVGVERI
jgi:hypothetical protein